MSDTPHPVNATPTTVTGAQQHTQQQGEGAPRTSNFVRDIIDAHLEEGVWDHPITRFPPEPNGYLHIGHAKSICLNFGIARDYAGGVCHLRFDDTNPTKEDTEYVESIQRDVKWLGFDWGEHLYFASDYFERMYQYAVQLIKGGHAYVCDLDEAEIRAMRGTLKTPGEPSPGRERSVEENLDLFARMRAGEFEDGAYVLRANIDMSDPNMLMRDPILYRIRHAHHHRTGDAWCIYPMYDYAHCLEDYIEGISHSICTLEFENNRELYDWILDTLGFETPRTRQYEFARLSLAYTMMSKRKLLKLVQDGLVSGWDDPRMPTLAGMRRRGYTPESIQAFCAMIGVAKTNSVVDFDKLEYCVRDDLNHRAPRAMGVLRPLKVVLTNYPEDKVERITVPSWPHDVPREGEEREVPFGKTLYIERTDFAEVPPKGFRRLSPGACVRLRRAYVIRCDEVIRDDAGEVVELRCSYEPDSLGGGGSKTKGIIHWVSAAHAVTAEVRLYEPLFVTEQPGDDWLNELNPASLTVLSDAKLEPSLSQAATGDRFQFERQGYFILDADTADGRPVFNRIVALKSSWTPPKRAEAAPAADATGDPSSDAAASSASDGGRVRPDKKSRAEIRIMLRAQDPALAARYARLQADLGLSAEDADVITADHATADLYEAALGAYSDTEEVTKWFVNEMLRVLKDVEPGDLKFDGAAFGALVKLVHTNVITSNSAKTVFDHMVAEGGDPAAIVEARGLKVVSDADALQGTIQGILDANPDPVARYRAGKKALLGFFIGQAMKATRGKADPKVVKQLVREALDAAE